MYRAQIAKLEYKVSLDDESNLIYMSVRKEVVGLHSLQYSIPVVQSIILFHSIAPVTRYS